MPAIQLEILSQESTRSKQNNLKINFSTQQNPITFSYNNIFFFVIFIALSFFLMPQSVSLIFNCLGSMYGAAGLVYLFSTSSK